MTNCNKSWWRTTEQPGGSVVVNANSEKTVQGLWPKMRSAGGAMRRRVQQRWHNDGQPARPIFLMGAGRSGTTMLVAHLGRTWQIDSYNENHPAAFQDWYLRSLPIVREIVQASPARVVLFKSIRDTINAPRLLSEFPDAKVVFLFRHYDDVVHSSFKKLQEHDLHPLVRQATNNEFPFSAAPEATKRFISERNDLQYSKASSAALNWLFRNRLYFDHGLDKEPRVYLVQYEAVVTKPRETFQELCNFLGVEFEGRMIKGVYTTSVKRSPRSDVDEQLRLDCEELWQDLCREARSPRPDYESMHE